MYYDYNDISMIYINFNIAMLSVRNHQMVINNNVLDNSARLEHHSSAYKIPCTYEMNDPLYNSSHVNHQRSC